MRRGLAIAASAIAAVTLGACAPLAIRSASHPPAPLAQAAATHEYPSPPAPAQAIAGPAAASPTAAIDAFATTYINWTAHTVVSQLQALAAASIGQARSAMQLAAAQTAGDYELQRGGVQNSGRVVAVAPVIGQPDQYAVVTREQTSATNTTAYQGLRPAWHLTLATVTRLGPRAWVVSGWQPES
jgi:hypothetical protein